MRTLHICLDETGDFTFSPSGTHFYIFAATWTYDPAPLARDLTGLRFSLLKAGDNIPAFHATDDKKANRDKVVKVLVRHDNWQYASIVIEKSKVPPSSREPSAFYPKYASVLLRFIFRGRLHRGTRTILIFTHRLPVQKYRERAEKVIKETCRSELLSSKIPFYAYYHPLESNSWIQATDYCAWALRRKWEMKDLGTYNELKIHLAAEELDLLKDEATRYY